MDAGRVIGLFSNSRNEAYTSFGPPHHYITATRHRPFRYPEGTFNGQCEHAMLHGELRRATGRLMAQNKRWRLHVGGDHSNVVAQRRMRL